MLGRLRLGIESDRKVSLPVYLFYMLVCWFGRHRLAYLHNVQPGYYGLGMVLATLRRLY